MPVQYVTTTGPQPDRLIASGYPAITRDVTVASGEGQISRGQLLGVNRAGKYRKYVVPTAVTGENVGQTDATNKDYVKTTANRPLMPGSVKVTVGTTVFYDNGSGQLEGGANAHGAVYYDRGVIELHFASAPGTQNILVDYRYSTLTDGSHLPVAVAAEDVDATSGDKTCAVYITGHFRRAALLPDVSNDPWVAGWLRKLGIFVEG